MNQKEMPEMRDSSRNIKAPIGTILILVGLLSSGPRAELPGEIAVAGSELSDNGDDDGFADTNETVSARLWLHNGTGITLTGVTARLETDDPKIECISSPVVFVGAF